MRDKKREARFRLCLALAAAVFLVLLAAFGRWLAPYDPLEVDYGAVMAPPGREHLCGTDRLGRDIFSRILWGAGSSFFLTFVMVAVTSLTGVAVGLTAGLLGGGTDTVLMRLIDVLLAFPGSVFAIAVAGIMGAGIFHTVLALALVWWTKYARLTRNMASEIRNKDYIIQARFGGAGDMGILWRYILPNILPQAVIMASLDVGGMMMSLAGLSFLGLASQPPAPEWGYMLFESRQYMQTAPWMMIAPGAAILITVIIFNLLGDAVRDVLDPKE